VSEPLRERVSAIELAAVEEYLLAYELEIIGICVPPSKRGPNNVTAVAVAQLIAAQYTCHFGRNPAHAKGGVVGNREGEKIVKTPFDRVCDLVEDYSLQELRVPLSLSDSARGEAIRRNKECGPLA
jgi:hypothetical protein